MGHHTVKNGYKSLADRLNLFPQGVTISDALFPLLEALVDENEAKILSQLPLKPFTAHKAAKVLKKSETETEKILVELCEKAILLDVVNMKGEREFILPPPMAGFFEFSLMRVGSRPDQKELAELFHQYLNVKDDFFRELLLGGSTKLGRIYVNEQSLEKSRECADSSGIEPGSLNILDYESSKHMVEASPFVAVGTCYCRHKKYHLGTNCDAPMDDICITLGNVAASLTKYGHAREISKSEGVAVIELAYEHNLVQMSENAQNDIPFLCNCCGCCCEALGAVKKFGTLATINTSNFLPDVKDNCIGCGICAKVCPIDVITIEEIVKEDGSKGKKAIIDENACLGCGVCVRKCKFNALHLKSTSSRKITPLNSTHRIVNMALERGKLQNLIFDNQALQSNRVMSSILGAILKLDHAKRLLANQQLQSIYLKKYL